MKIPNLYQATWSVFVEVEPRHEHYRAIVHLDRLAGAQLDSVQDTVLLPMLELA